MISPENRLKLQDICDRIAEHKEVSLTEMAFVTKWAEHNRVAQRMLNQARRISIQGKPPKGSMDELLNSLDLGDPDPANHLQGPQTPIDIAEWFMRDKREDWRQRD